MSDNSSALTVRVLSASPRAVGEVVRLTGTDTVGLVQASSSAALVGTLGVMQSAVDVVVAGQAKVRLDSGLTPVAGDSIYVSALTAGRATTVIPANALILGVIVDPSRYAIDGTVVANILPNSTLTSGGGGGEADWALNRMRFYAVDNDGGDDGNVGFADATGTTQTDMEVAAQLAGTRALRTVTRLFEILPPIGAGRSVTVLIKTRTGGATYVDANGVTETLSTISLRGYAYRLIRGTNSFLNTTAERLEAGAIRVQDGPGAGGVWTVDAGATVSTIPVVGGGLNAEPALLGYRIRFVTGALANACINVQANTGSVITTGTDLSGAPVAGDTFVIEQPGVRFARVLEVGQAAITPVVSTGSIVSYQTQLVGIASVNNTTGAFSIANTASSVAFCEVTGAAATTSGLIVTENMRVQITRVYRDELGNNVLIGMGMVSSGTYSVSNNVNVLFSHSGMKSTSTGAFTNNPSFIVGSGGSYFGGQVFCDGGLQSAHEITTSLSKCMFGTTAATDRRTRVNGTGGLRVTNGSTGIRKVDITNSGAGAAIEIRGNGSSVTIDDVIGSTGNTGYGIYCEFATNINLSIGVGIMPTVTGSLGDIRVADATMSYAALQISTGLTDYRNNRIFNAVVNLGVGQTQCFLVNNVNGSALAAGDVVRGNGVGAGGEVLKAQGDVLANAEGPLLVMLTDPANAANGYAAAIDSGAWVNFADGGPTTGAIAYLNPTTAGTATSTIPAAGTQRRRLGHVIRTLSGRAKLTGSCELLPVTSNATA